MTRKVLFIASDFKPKPGGRADYIDNLARGLRSNGIDARVLAVVGADRGGRTQVLKNYEEWVLPFEMRYEERPANWLMSKAVSGLEIVRCLSPRMRPVLERVPAFRGTVEASYRLTAILDELTPDMVIFGHLDMRLYPLALCLTERKVPYGIIAHGWECPYRPYRVNDFVRRSAILNGASRVAANSHYTRDLFGKWRLPPEAVRIVYPPIAEDAVQYRADRASGRREEEFTLVTLCRVVTGKGIDIVLRALKILLNRNIPCRYVIGGDGDQLGSLQELCDKLGLRDRVIFVGAVSGNDKWKLLAQSDVYVMASRIEPTSVEGFGIAFIEAGALGLPAVGSNIGGIPDAIVDGKTGLVVPDESPEELAEALVFLYQNPDKRQELGRRGMERARSEFSPSAVASRFEREVLSVV